MRVLVHAFRIRHTNIQTRGRVNKAFMKPSYFEFYSTTRLLVYRQMLGVHYRIDSTEGLTLGETAGIRLLHQVRNVAL